MKILLCQKFIALKHPCKYFAQTDNEYLCVPLKIKLYSDEIAMSNK